MFLILLTTLALANPWLIKAPQANAHEYAVFLQNSNFEKISSLFLSCQNSMKELSQKAQIEFLEGELLKARHYYLDMIEQQWSCDWSSQERELISFAFFRLAQLETQQDKQQFWLESVIHFDDTYQPDVSLFPPPLLESYKNLLQKIPKIRILLPESSKKFSAILRNGKLLPLNQLSIEERIGKARFTFLSETYQPEKVFLPLKELETLNLVPRPLVSGDCDHPQVDESLSTIGKISIFFGVDCVHDIDPLKESQKSSIATEQNSQNSSMLTDIKAEVPVDSSSKNWIQRNGLWLGAVIASSVLISYHLQNQKQESAPTLPTTTMHTQQR